LDSKIKELEEEIKKQEELIKAKEKENQKKQEELEQAINNNTNTEQEIKDKEEENKKKQEQIEQEKQKLQEQEQKAKEEKERLEQEAEKNKKEQEELDKQKQEYQEALEDTGILIYDLGSLIESYIVYKDPDEFKSFINDSGLNRKISDIRSDSNINPRELLETISRFSNYRGLKSLLENDNKLTMDVKSMKFNN
jgi:chromosome segregation ATPase